MVFDHPGATLKMVAPVVLVRGCATVRPVIQPKPWDRHADSGPLQVFGADPTSPGPQAFQALLREPSLEALLICEGQPDSIGVVSSDAHRSAHGSRRGAPRKSRVYSRLSVLLAEAAR